MLVKTSAWKGRRVLVTGHTGFKGGWLSLWLHQLGAEVTGFSLPAPTDPSLFEQTRLAELVNHVEGDVRDMDAVEAAVNAARPEVVFHLAAQPLVRYSYDNPIETYATNVMGTVHLLDACRRAESVRAIVSVTSDKCYENREWVWPYRESDPMGGHDPYSSSKGAAELVISAYRRSFFETGRMHRIRSRGQRHRRRRLGDGPAHPGHRSRHARRRASPHPQSGLGAAVAACDGGPERAIC